MKATGIVRPMDNFGRVVIPIEIRRSHNFDVNQNLEFYVDGENIIISKYQRNWGVLRGHECTQAR